MEVVEGKGEEGGDWSGKVTVLVFVLLSHQSIYRTAVDPIIRWGKTLIILSASNVSDSLR